MRIVLPRTAAPVPALAPALAPSLALALALAACVPAPRVAPPPPAPAPVPVATPSPAPLAADWRDWPLTPGDWRYRRDGTASVATYGTATPLLSLRCDPAARTVMLTLATTADAPATLRTSTTRRTLAGAVTTLAATDPLLEAMGFSRGRFVVEQPGSAPLVVPAWAEIERVTEDCR